MWPMVTSLKKHLKVIHRLWLISVQKGLAFRWQFLTDLIDESASVALSLLMFDIAYDHTPAIGGWSQHQAVLLVGVFQIYSVVQGVFFEPNFASMSSAIFEGKLDGLLLRPVSAQLLVSLREIKALALLRLLPGLAVVVYALKALGHSPGLFDLCVACGLLLSGIGIVYAIWLATMTLEFWYPGLWSLELLVPDVFRFASYPDGIYKGATKALFLTVVPVILIANYPTHALLGSWSVTMVLHAVGLACMLMGLSRIQWRHSLRHYSSASS